jgi:NCAIR mutase (PurE)-related protein
MDNNTIKKLLTRVKKGDLTIENALQSFKELPYKDMGFAKVDTHRTIRCGFPEVIFFARERLRNKFSKLPARSLNTDPIY